MKTTVASRPGIRTHKEDDGSVRTVHSRVATGVLTAWERRRIGASFRPQEMREIPPMLSVRLYRTCNPVVNSFFWEEDGEARRCHDAAS